MDVYRKGSLLLAALATFTLAGPAQSAAFVDPLDVPAMKSPLAGKSPVNAVTMAGRRLVGVGQRGHILYSDDQGKSWTQASVPVSSDLTAVTFVTPEKGWAVGHDGVVLATTDGGANWVRQLDGRALGKILLAAEAPAGLAANVAEQRQADLERLAEQGASNPLLGVFFEDENTGYVFGSFNLILKTTDGGKSWASWFDRTDNPSLMGFFAMRPVDGELFLVGEQGLVLKYDRQAGRFRALALPYKGTLFGVTGKAGVVIVHGLRGSVYRSTDKGATWRRIDVGLKDGVTAADVTPDGRIVLASQVGQIVVSNDDGATFAPLAVSGPRLPVAGVVADSKDSLVIAGIKGLRPLTNAATGSKE